MSMEHCPPRPLSADPRIVFMGTPDFAVPSLMSLLESGYEVSSVVTQPDRPRGRGRKLVPPPVKAAAEERGCIVLQPESVNRPEFPEALRAQQPDLIVVVAFGQILRPAILSVPRWGVVNIHASLLPRYRGPAPIQWAVLNDEPRTGLTLMCMEQGLDTGPILYQEEVKIAPKETAGHLHDKLAAMSGGFLLRSLHALMQGPVISVPQDPLEASYAPKITRAMTRIDWHMPARAIAAQIRALDPAPGAGTTFKGHTLKLFRASQAGTAKEESPGRVWASGERLVVEAGEGRVSVGEIQISGKRRMPVSDFLRGFPLQTGNRLGT